MIRHNEKARVIRKNPLETTLLAVQEARSEVVYECVMCGGRTMLSEIEHFGGRVKCPNCGYRVLKKTRSPVVKRLRAV